MTTAGLLRHELRLQWRRMQGRRFGPALAAVAVLFWAAMHAPAWLIAREVTRVQISPLTEQAVTSAVLLLLTGVMLSQAVGGAIEALYERRDLDWLLTTPVPIRQMLAVRVLALAAGIVWPFLMLLGPVAHTMAYFGRPGLLFLYPVVAVLALAVSALGAMGAVGLVAVFGMKRARTVTGMLAFVMAGLVFLAVQVPRLVTPALQDLLMQRPVTEDAPGMAVLVALWPARAVLGDVAALAQVMAAGLAIAVAVNWFVGRLFLRGIITAESRTVARPARSQVLLGPPRLRGRRVLVRKEMRLLWRAPDLVGKVLGEVVILFPGLALLWGGGTSLALGALPVFAAGGLARRLMLLSAGDPAAELALSSPMAAGRVERAKL